MISWLKKTFIPHEANDHHPHFWRDRSVGLMLAIFFVAEVAVFAQSYLIFDKSDYLAAVLPSVINVLVNDQRTINDASPLAENPLLTEAAQLKAQDMATKGYFSHTTPEGYSSWYWLDKVGYSYSHAGENLAVNFTDSKDVVDAWMNSPTHRANIVKQVYTETGVGMAEGVYQGKPAIFVAQFFGTPGVAIIATSSEVAAVETPNTQPAPDATTPPEPVLAVKNQVKNSSSSALVSTSTSIAGNEAVTGTATTSIASVETNINPSLVAGAEVDTNIAVPGLAQTLAASPRHAGMYLFYLFLILILVALGLVLFNKNGVRTHHPRIIAMAMALVLIVGGLIVLNQEVLKNAVVVGQGNQTLPIVTI